LARKVALALTSGLFDVLFPLLCGTKFDFLEEAMIFLGEATPALRDKTDKLAWIFRDGCLEKQFKRT
jgi:hypothetical protein